MKRYFLSICSVLLMACSDSGDNKQNSITQEDSFKNATSQDTAGTIRRFGMVTGIKANKIDYYKKLHAAAWPGVLKKIKACNIQNYSIYLQKIEDKYYLFSYFEYAGTNFDADMKKMAADSVTQRWWKETDPTQDPLPAAAAKNKIWTAMEKVFHAD